MPYANCQVAHDLQEGAQWLSGREGPRVRASAASLHCGPLARHIYPSLVLVQPRKTCPFLTERLLMGRKESNQTNKQKMICRKHQAVCAPQTKKSITQNLLSAEVVTEALREYGYSVPDKSLYWKTIFFISHPKHMLWVLKRTVQ